MTQVIRVEDTNVFIEGNGDETIVMIHGWPDTYRLWDEQVDVLKENYRCVRFTLPGYENSAPRRMYDLQEVIDIFNSIISTISNGEKVILMLHDWGCFFGYQYYMQHPETVSKIIGVDVGDAGSPDHVLSTKAKIFMFCYQMWLATAWKLGGSLGDKMTRKMAKLLNAPGDPALISSSMTYSYYWKWSHTLTGRSLGHKPLVIDCPFLYLYGKNKPGMFHSKNWENQMAKKPGNKVMSLPTRHWVMKEQKETFNHAVLDWLK